MANQITTQQPSIDLQELNALTAVANQLCKSEALPACYKNAANVLVALQTGREMGLQPMQSLNSLYIVNGKIQIWGSSQVQLLKAHGWKLKIKEHTNEVCTINIFKDDESFEYTTTFAELPSGSKAKAFAPKEKLYYHTISRLVRFYCPEVLGGMSNLYNESEVEDIETNKTTPTVDTSKITVDISDLPAPKVSKAPVQESQSEVMPKIDTSEVVKVSKEKKVATEKQIKQLFGTLNSKIKDKTQVDDFIQATKARYNLESIKDITMAQYDEVVELLEQPQEGALSEEIKPVTKV